MVSTSSFRRSVKSRLDQEKQVWSGLEQRIDDLQRQQEHSINKEHALYQQLAELYIQLPIGQAIHNSLEQVVSIRNNTQETRAEQIRKLGADIEERHAYKEELDAQYSSAEDLLGQATQEIIDTQELIARELHQHPTYTHVLAHARQSERRIDSLEEELERSTKEREEKIQAYQQDPIFAYLLRQEANPNRGKITKFLDNALAKYSGFVDNRDQYQEIIDLPIVVAEELDKEKANYETLSRSQERIEQGLEQEYGLEDSIEKRDGLEAEMERLEEAAFRNDATIYSLIDEREVLREHRGVYQKRMFEQTLHLLAGHSMQQLATVALSTPETDDDMIVAAIAEEQDKQATLQNVLETLDGKRREQAEKVGTLEEAYDDAQNHARRHDHYRSDVDESMIDDLIIGKLALDVFTDSLNSSAYSRSRTSSSSSSYRRSSSSSFGGGSFSSGGGFGGGGFSTGGGF